MQKNALIAVIAVAVLVVAGASVAVVMMNNGDNKDKTPETYDTDGIRLKIYGNANGDDIIDEKDKTAIQEIIDKKITNWKKDYYYADANHDGKITSDDIAVVDKIIKKESVKMWYESAFSTKDKYDGSNDRLDAYVNYPIGTKVGCEYSDVDILSVLGVYSYFSATSTTAQSDYGDTLYPGISSLPTIGDKDHLTAEAIAKLVDNGTINTFIQWTGGTSTNYLWDTCSNIGLTDKVSIVMVTVQGEHCVDGALMLACMFGNQSLSDKYVKWFDNAVKTLDKITDDMKKTALVMKTFNADNATNVKAYMQYQSPALWFNKIINFTPNTSGSTGFVPLTTSQSIQKEIEDGKATVVLCQTKHTPKVTNQEEYNTWAAAKLGNIFGKLPIYAAKEIYTIDFSLMPFFGGPAACLLLASQIYGDDVISYAEASKIVDDYCKDFMPPGSNTAKGMSWGYTYTGWMTA